MLQNFSLHTHTNQFDGKNSVNEMVAQAQKLGMTAIGISNHFIVHPDIKKTNFYPFAVQGGYQNIYHDKFSSVINEFEKNYEEINRVAEKYDIRVLRGMEVDFFNSWTWHKGFERAIEILKPDYIIGACHFIEYKDKLCNVHDIANADERDGNRMLEIYWCKIRNASRARMFSFLAHLDLPKKVGVGQSPKWRDVERYTIEDLAWRKNPIEINTSGIPKNKAPYPDAYILNRIARTGLPVVISDDAHSTKQIGQHFDTAEYIINAHQIQNRLTLQKILDFSIKSL